MKRVKSRLCATARVKRNTCLFSVTQSGRRIASRKNKSENRFQQINSRKELRELKMEKSGGIKRKAQTITVHYRGDGSWFGLQTKLFCSQVFLFFCFLPRHDEKKTAIETAITSQPWPISSRQIYCICMPGYITIKTYCCKPLCSHSLAHMNKDDIVCLSYWTCTPFSLSG